MSLSIVVDCGNNVNFGATCWDGSEYFLWGSSHSASHGKGFDVTPYGNNIDGAPCGNSIHGAPLWQCWQWAQWHWNSAYNAPRYTAVLMELKASPMVMASMVSLWQWRWQCPCGDGVNSAHCGDGANNAPCGDGVDDSPHGVTALVNLKCTTDVDEVEVYQFLLCVFCEIYCFKNNVLVKLKITWTVNLYFSNIFYFYINLPRLNYVLLQRITVFIVFVDRSSWVESKYDFYLFLRFF